MKGRKGEEMAQDNFKEVQMELQANSAKETVDQQMIQDEDSYSEIKKEDRSNPDSGAEDELIEFVNSPTSSQRKTERPIRLSKRNVK